MKKGLNTTKSFIIWILGLCIGYVWATFFPNAPFDTFAYTLTGGLTIIVSKRLFVKHNKFNNYEQEDTGVHED